MIFILIVVFFIRLILSYYQDSKSKPKYSDFIKDEINQAFLEKKAIEIRKKLPKFLHRKNKPSLAYAFSYVGLKLSVGIDNLRKDQVMICHFKEKSNPNSGDIIYQFSNAKLQELRIDNKDNLLSSNDRIFWRYILKQFISDGWKEIILKSVYRNMDLYKFCIYKDDVIIIYELKTFSHSPSI